MSHNSPFLGFANLNILMQFQMGNICSSFWGPHTDLGLDDIANKDDHHT